ncbi:Uncharacterised protein [uncultured archaeon]|nr:Uncharacterised protein [uncultured archaeon]
MPARAEYRIGTLREDQLPNRPAKVMPFPERSARRKNITVRVLRKISAQ